MLLFVKMDVEDREAEMMTRSEVQRTNKPSGADAKLARRLVLDELFDLSLYQSLRDVATGELRTILEQLIPIETRHLKFWQDFFDLHVERLNPARRLKLALIVAACRLLGASVIHLVLEAIEVYGVRKYLKVWTAYGSGPLGTAVRSVLVDEFKHEDTVVTGNAERRLNPERVRNIFLGLNDGLVEILGAVSGFFAAFGNSIAVLAAGLTVAVAGALSMAAGAWVAASSEAEVRATEAGRRRFLGESAVAAEAAESPVASAFVVGLSYFAGALVPVLPVIGGAGTVLPSLFTAGSLIIIVSMILAFLSGMDITRRVVTNLVIIAAAVGITFTIGQVTKLVWGVSL
jgi:VIT1/CCC1 family predicted Fe2+/Mn2+ transporter